MSYIAGMDLTRIDSSREFELGTIGRTNDGRLYKYITYSNEAAAVAGVAGEVCYYVAATGYAANDVTSDITASDEVGAGVLQASLTDNSFGWIQIRGQAILTIALTVQTDGANLTPTGSADGSLDVIDTTSAATANKHVCAITGDGSANEIMCQFPE